MNIEQNIKHAGSWSNKHMWKLAFVALITLILMIPVAWISSIIRERYNRKTSVIEEIAGKWGGSQIVSGPILSIPYSVKVKSTTDDGKELITEVDKYIHIAPDSIRVQGKVETVMHQRGIFKVTGYKAALDIKASFAPYAVDNPAYSELPLRWNDALLCFDIDDQRGMKEIKGDANGAPLVFNRSEGVLSIISLPETTNLKDTFSAYKGDAQEKQEQNFKLEAKVPVDNRAEAITINIKTTISGTQQLNFASSALSESVNLEGDWQSPSFIGDLLPESRTVNAEGFKASWHTSNLNNGIKKTWTSDEPTLQLSNLGVNFLIMVDNYQQTTRSLKYSVLFLLLTFMTFFFAEIMTRQRIHPIQYLMVGFGLLIFYLLLLSISEHIAFAWSYLIAASGVILQISLYCYSILKTRRFALQVASLLSFLYVFLYVLLRLQDSALLIGSISLFVLLSLAMYIIRNVNWYSQD